MLSLFTLLLFNVVIVVFVNLFSQIYFISRCKVIYLLVGSHHVVNEAELEDIHWKSYMHVVRLSAVKCRRKLTYFIIIIFFNYYLFNTKTVTDTKVEKPH